MLYFCALCGGPLTPGLRLCQCGQVFGHPVPDFDVQGEPGARYWPPRQPSSAEATFHRAQNWWGGISNKRKAVASGVAVVLLLAMIGAGNRSDEQRTYQADPEQEQSSSTRDAGEPASVAADGRPQTGMPLAASPVIAPPVFAPPATPAPRLASIQPSFDLNVPDLDAVSQGNYSKRLFGVANPDASDWTNVQIVINPGFGGYSVQLPVLHPSAGRNPDGTLLMSEILQFEQFADGYGNRFQQGMKVNRIQITCNTPSGPASCTTTFTD